MKSIVSFNFLLLVLGFSLTTSKFLAASGDVEDIIFRMSNVVFEGVYKTPFEVKTCNMDLKIHYNPILKVDPVFNTLILDIYEILPYKDDYEKYTAEREDFEKCGFDKIFGFSQQFTRMHLNFNSDWNGGFYVKQAQMADIPGTGDWSVQIEFDNASEQSKVLLVNLEFENMRSKEETQILVDYFNTLKR